MHESGLPSPRRLGSSRPVTLSNSVLSRMVISRPWESVLSCHSASVLSHVAKLSIKSHSHVSIVGICLANAIRPLFLESRSSSCSLMFTVSILSVSSQFSVSGFVFCYHVHVFRDFVVKSVSRCLCFSSRCSYSVWFWF